MNTLNNSNQNFNLNLKTLIFILLYIILVAPQSEPVQLVKGHRSPNAPLSKNTLPRGENNMTLQQQNESNNAPAIYNSSSAINQDCKFFSYFKL